MKHVLLFLVGALLFAVPALGIAATLGDENLLLQGATAFALAFVPGLATLAVVLIGFRKKPDLQLLVAFAGTGVRMGIALGGGYLVTNLWPLIFAQPFWNWLILYYLGLLGLEVTLLANAFRSPSVPAAAGAGAERDLMPKANHHTRGNA
jgi:hypothetical protein